MAFPLSFSSFLLGAGGGCYIPQVDLELLDPPASGTGITDVTSIPVWHFHSVHLSAFSNLYNITWTIKIYFPKSVKFLNLFTLMGTESDIRDY